MITIVATQTVVPGKETALQALMLDLTAKVKASEPGCVTFDWVRDTVDARRYLVIEQYADEAAYCHHMGTPYLAAFLPHLSACLQDAPAVTICGDVVARPPRLPPSYFHIGVVVPDLAAAVAHYSDVLGIRFTEPATFKVPRLEDPEPHPGELVAAFSMTEPPYYELIQAAGDGIIAARNAGRILYFGAWEADMAGRLATLRAKKVGIDALFRMDADSPPFAMITAPACRARGSSTSTSPTRALSRSGFGRAAFRAVSGSPDARGKSRRPELSWAIIRRLSGLAMTIPLHPRVTRAADGLFRRRFSVAEVEEMVAAGLLADERNELIGGELVPMSPKGNRHERVKIELVDAWVRLRPNGYRLAPETTFRLSEDTYLEPDFVVYETASGLKGLTGETALLVVEISDSSLRYDMGRKAALYSGFGVRDLWVIDAVKLVTHVFRTPAARGYRNVREVAVDKRITPLVAPKTFALRLADLGID